jgi:hypothetical protein
MESKLENSEFLKRRNQKNWIVLSIIIGCVALIWGTTLLKLQALPKDSPFHKAIEKTEEKNEKTLP